MLFQLSSSAPLFLCRVQMALFLLLYPVSFIFHALHGYRWHFSLSCTRFSSDFVLKSGTDRTFPFPVPGFRLTSRSDRVQIALFILLYPVFVWLCAKIGYRLHFFFSCTRLLSFFLLCKGTDHAFPSPVPLVEYSPYNGVVLIFCSA